jgi:hypothetical protein
MNDFMEHFFSHPGDHMFKSFSIDANVVAAGHKLEGVVWAQDEEIRRLKTELAQARTMHK